MALRRIVVEISRIAATTMIAPRPRAAVRAAPSTRNRGSTTSRWSRTSDTPAVPENSSLTTEYCSGLTSLMRNANWSMSGVVHWVSALLPLRRWKFSYASSFVSSYT